MISCSDEMNKIGSWLSSKQSSDYFILHLFSEHVSDSVDGGLVVHMFVSPVWGWGFSSFCSVCTEFACFPGVSSRYSRFLPSLKAPAALLVCLYLCASGVPESPEIYSWFPASGIGYDFLCRLSSTEYGWIVSDQKMLLVSALAQHITIFYPFAWFSKQYKHKNVIISNSTKSADSFRYTSLCISCYHRNNHF